MNATSVDQMRAVTIAREYGSGGGEIAKRLAERLNWQLLDHEIVERVALRLGLSASDIEQYYDECRESFVDKLLDAMRYIPSVPEINALAYDEDAIDKAKYRSVLHQVLHAAIGLGHTVIVGRGSQFVLAEQRDILRIKVVAPLGERIDYVMRRENLDHAAARSRIQRKDHDRLKDLEEQYKCDPEDDHNYDLTINTGVISLDGAVSLICLALEEKSLKLRLPEEELGPGSGLSSYPEKA